MDKKQVGVKDKEDQEGDAEISIEARANQRGLATVKAVAVVLEKIDRRLKI
jgi:hypothetical protein